MKAPTMLLFWIFMTALAFPLVVIAIAAIGASIYAATFEQQENNDPICCSSTCCFGPFSIQTNARRWAGLCVISGIVVTAIGLIGLFHFPTPSLTHLKENPDHIEFTSS
jgi:hypothetical protein